VETESGRLYHRLPYHGQTAPVSNTPSRYQENRDEGEEKVEKELVFLIFLALFCHLGLSWQTSDVLYTRGKYDAL